MRTAARALAILAFVAGPAAASDGWEFLAKGKPTFARTAFTNQLRRTPDDERVRVGLGMAELALGNPDKACEILLGAIKKLPADRDARLALAQSFLLRGRKRLATGHEDDETRFLLLDAEGQAQKAAELKDDDPEPWIVITEARLELGQCDRAEQAIGEAERRGLDPAKRRRLRGELSYFLVASQAQEGSQEGYAEAKEGLVALIREDPGSATLRLRLGDLHHAFGNWEEALEAWQQGLEIEPFDRPTLDRLLTYLRAPELRAKARVVLESAAAAAEKIAGAADPRPAYAIMCAGQCRLLDRDLDGATQAFKKAQKLDPALEVECSLGLANADYRSQKYDEAGAAFRAAFHADAAGAKTLIAQMGQSTALAGWLQFLAKRAFEKTKRDDARELLEIATLLETESAQLWNDYAFLCRETGKAQKSWDAYARVIELAPDNPRYLNDAALVLQDYLKKDFARARQLYQRAIAAADATISDASKPQVVRDAAADAKRDATANLARLPAK